MSCGRSPRRARLPGRFPSSPFLWWAMGLALTAGFGLGMVLFLHLAAGQSTGLWWVAAVQAHGHIQLFGWAGMFALGVGLYFLPRLRGCPARLRWPSGCGLADGRRAGDAGALPADRCGARAGLASQSPPAWCSSCRPAGVGRRRTGRGRVGPRGAAVRRSQPGRACRGIPFALTFFVSLILALTINAVVPGDRCDRDRAGLRGGRLNDRPSGTGGDARPDLGGRLGAHLPALLAAARSGAPRVVRRLRRYLTGLMLRSTSRSICRRAPVIPSLGAVILGLAFVGRGRAGCPVQALRRSASGRRSGGIRVSGRQSG